MILRKSSLSAQFPVLIVGLLWLSWFRICPSAQISWIWGKIGQSCTDTCTEALNLVTYTPITNSRCYEFLWTSVTTVAEMKTKRQNSQNWNGKVGTNQVPSCKVLLASQKIYYPGYDGSGYCYVGNGTTSSCGTSYPGFFRICPCDSSTDNPTMIPTLPPTPLPSMPPTLGPTGVPSPAPSAFSISGTLQDLFSSVTVGTDDQFTGIVATGNPVGFVAALAIPRITTGGKVYILDSLYHKIWLLSISISTTVTFTTINIGTSVLSSPMGMTVVSHPNKHHPHMDLN